MNAAAIESAAKEISRLTLALGWLRSHGLQALMPVGDAFSVVVSLNSCSALPGAKEAATQLGAQARLVMGGEVLANAIKDAANVVKSARARCVNWNLQPTICATLRWLRATANDFERGNAR